MKLNSREVIPNITAELVVWVSVAPVQKVGDLWLQEVGITQSESVTIVLLKKDSFRVNVYLIQQGVDHKKLPAVGPSWSSFKIATSQVYMKITISWPCMEIESIINCCEIKSDFKSIAHLARGLSDQNHCESFEGFPLERHKNQHWGYHRCLPYQKIEPQRGIAIWNWKHADCLICRKMLPT